VRTPHLQLAFYSDAITRIQGTAPEFMHVLLGIAADHLLIVNVSIGATFKERSTEDISGRAQTPAGL
jgi:hypothetical protein